MLPVQLVEEQTATTDQLGRATARTVRTAHEPPALVLVHQQHRVAACTTTQRIEEEICRSAEHGSSAREGGGRCC